MIPIPHNWKGGDSLYKSLEGLRISLADLLVRERLIRKTDQRHPMNVAALQRNLVEQQLRLS